MFYREAGQFKTSYAADSAILPIRQDRIFIIALLLFAFVAVPGLASDYLLSGILIPFLVLSLAALGLNLLTGYAGQLSLGSAAFMAVGAYATYNFMLRVPGMPLLLALVLGGLSAALVGILFGLPSLRIKGFYLAVATLAAQFLVEWVFTKFPWFSNDSSSGVISSPVLSVFGMTLDTPAEKYLLTLAIVAQMALAAKNMVRSSLGRAWMAIRDMDVAAEVIGIRMLRTKLLAFAISSFYCGVAGALYAFVFLGTVDAQAFDLNRSFQILFMIIIGGVGSILGAFLGAAFIVLLPVLLNLAGQLLHGAVSSQFMSNLEMMIFGALIIFFLAVEPLGLARLWQISKEKLRLWPFPH
ncbi:branched-chain amino acid ABC transporter permease [Craterilacuibacter sp. RT1T]|uniref:branched-chain amino acid ABC transporter permease n=1 Tax=Craterilacuibacter sp. RT1T TaxID=2942211 RepID=UPI0020BDC9EB|nr:branched-chain amino acid ABC transporter permease [Craterilacuibacter sp. RT1T]MCL6263238.1 branched-chain amino acid ABC transporter permease [Craterilacuibacter sp. RT1T]